MFDAAIYRARRQALRRRLGGGLALFVGNGLAAMNYRDNTYPFVQDGSFSYFFGLDDPDLIGLIDADSGDEWLFGNDTKLEDLVWHGPLQKLSDRAARVGVTQVGTLAEAVALVSRISAKGAMLHYPPPYRGETILVLGDLLKRTPAAIVAQASPTLVRAIVALREIKGAEEVAEMESALDLTAQMHIVAMRASRPRVFEREVVAEIERCVRRHDRRLAYPVIFTRSGEILHNFTHHQMLEAGDLVVNDSGAASALGYASDITRTIPVGGFTSQGRDLYAIVLAAQQAAIDALRPDVPFVGVHKLSMRVLVEKLRAFGVFRGDASAVVDSGAYAIICQGGLGHQIGLDVHDMEGLGEDQVGYDGEVQRSPLFGMNRLRLGKRLKPGMVVTIEPGLYFIPPLIAAWEAEGRFAHQINYEALRRLVGAGGLRVEDDVLITEQGARVLGPPIPKAIDEVEALVRD